MDISVCFLCLKRIENYSGGGQGGDGSHSTGFDINLKFWQFVKQYLSSPLIPSSEGGGGDGDDDGGINQLIMDMSMSKSRWATTGGEGEGGANNHNEKQSFCQDCEDLVSSVCNVHKKLVTAQLHLDWKLGEVGRLLKISKEKVSSKLGKMLIKSLADQMGLNKKHKVNRVDKVRSWLMKKCQQKGREKLPHVFVKRRKLLPKKAGAEMMKPNLLEGLPPVDVITTSQNKDIIKIEAEDQDQDPMLGMEVNDHLVMACEDWISDGPVDSFSLSNDGFDENGSPLNFSHEDDDNDVTNEGQEVPQKLKEEPVEPPKMSPLKDFSKTQSVDQNKNGSDSDLDELQKPDSRSRRKRSREAAAKKKDQDDLDDSTFEPDSSAEESSDQISSASDSDWSLPPPEKKPKKLILTVAKRGRGRPRKYPLNPSKPKPKPKPKVKQVKVQTDDDDDDGEIEGDKEELECPQCDKKLTNNHRLQSHIRFVHNPITCNLCQKDFIGQHSLRDHAAKEHQGEGNFSCPTCCRPFPSYYSMSRHMRRIHHDRRYTCPQCGVTVKTSRSLRLHTNAVHNPTPITCQHCGKVSSCLKYHREHIIHKHPETKEVSNANAVPIEKKYLCPICTKASFSRKTHLDRHLLSCGIKKVRSRKNKAESSEFQSYLCNFCGKEFTGKKNTYYRAHLLTHANLDDKEPTFQCHKCPTAFHFRHQLTQHVRRVHNMPKKGRRDLPPKMHLKCMFPSCGMRFPKGNGRKEHIAQSHADIKEGGGAAGFLCEDCGRLFRPEYKQRYEIHVEAHFGAKPFQCPHCPSTFSYTRNFDEHMKDYHSEGGKEKESKIDCTQEGCDKKFKVQSKLKKHLREDHGIRRPIGVRAMRRLLKAECGGNVPPKKDKEGADKGEKPKQMYLCHTCGKGFSGREYYKAHLLKHNEDDKPSIQCDQCPSTFHAMIQLKQHIRRNHKGLKKGRKILPKEVMLQCLFPPVEGEGGVQQKEEHVEENQGDKTESFQPNFSEIL